MLNRKDYDVICGGPLTDLKSIGGSLVRWNMRTYGQLGAPGANSTITRYVAQAEPF